MGNRLLPFQGPRLIFFTFVMLASLVVLVMRLYQWQFVQYQEFQAKAQENAIQAVPLPAPRGVIYDRFGVALALNAPAFNVSVVPAGLPDSQDDALAVLNRLSALIDVPATRAAADAAGKKNIRSLQEMVVEGEGIAPYRAVVVKTDVPQEVAGEILEDSQNLPGVQVGQPAAVRQYPTGSLTSQIVGYLGPIGAKEAEALAATGYNPAFERVGYAGVEASLEDELAGTRGLLTQVVDVAGLPVRTVSRVSPVAGKNVKLTIDEALQQGAEEALVNDINFINSKKNTTVTESGVVIAMNPRTGEILAMVSWPTYDNSRFARSIDAEYYFRVLAQNQQPFGNHAISSLYPPGSTWKLLTATAVAQEQIIDPNSVLFDSGVLYVQNRFAQFDVASRQKFVCWYPKGHGRVNLIGGIAWSCDVYFYQVGGGNPDVSPLTLRPGGLGIDNLDRYALMFGIGTQEGIELPGEVAGRMPDRTWKRRLYGESWSTGDTYNAAFGQGYVTVTPLQLLNAAASIANGGILYQPTVVNSYVDAEGNTLQAFKPRVERTLVLPTGGSPAVLNSREDMIIQGKDSLACVCAADSPFIDSTDTQNYDPNQKKRCTDDFKNNYHATVRVDRKMPVNGETPETHVADWHDVPYTVNLPPNYSLEGLCDPLLFDKTYQPPFVEPKNLGLIQQGMYGAVNMTGGTVKIVVDSLKITDNPIAAGKTGTAEYCDDLANKQGLCLPGAWPSHAWFVGYEPYPDPDIIAVAFIYNAGEGSVNAMPVVLRVLDCYNQLKQQRLTNGDKAPVQPCQIRPYVAGGSAAE